MLMLSKQAKEAIERQMYLKARDMDVAIFNYLDDAMEHDFVLDALMMYQNRDGGFAHGLHIDNYNTNTSVYQIYEAFRILDMCGFNSDCNLELYDLIINKACNYLYNREVPVNNKWYANTETNNKFAHSSDFEYSEETKVLFGYHPTGALIGYTLKFCKPTKAYYKKALKMANVFISDFLEKNELTRYEFISVNSFISSVEPLNILDLSNVKNHLKELALKQMTLDFDNYDAITPIIAADSLKDSEFDEAKNKNLEFIINSIKPHGLWENNKSWGYTKYAEEDSAKIKWIGAETVNNYYILKKYGRI